MHPAIPRLIELQRIDHQIADLRADLESIPKRIKEAENKLGGARADVAALRETHTANLTDRKKLELDAQQWRDRARKYREQSSAVKTNEAYKALQHEIANAEAEVAKAEDRQLEIMVAGEESDRRVKLAEARLKEAEQAVTAERREIEVQQADKKRKLEAALVEREGTVGPIPEELRGLYAKIGKKHNGTAMAQARDGQCRGCGMRILPHIYEDLRHERNEEIYRCETCGLILYTLEPLVPATPPDTGKTHSTASTSS